jgi:hypothetical protein
LFSFNVKDNDGGWGIVNDDDDDEDELMIGDADGEDKQLDEVELSNSRQPSTASFHLRKLTLLKRFFTAFSVLPGSIFAILFHLKETREAN